MAAFKVNEPSVASETLDGEVIVINLVRGTYYSLQNVAGAIWEMIVQGFDTEKVESELRRRYRVIDTEIGPALESFLDELEREELIVPRTEDAPASIPSTANGQNRTNGRDDDASVELVFERPVLNTYTDMQELLLLDPIHEVDETGWPNVKE